MPTVAADRKTAAGNGLPDNRVIRVVALADEAANKKTDTINEKITNAVFFKKALPDFLLVKKSINVSMVI